MATVLLKNSFTTASVPAGLSAGELAVNVIDKKLFVGNAVGGVVTLVDANTLVTSFNGLTGAVQGVSAAVAGTGISVSGATGSVTIDYILTSQTNKATPVATDLVQINDGSVSTFPRRATIGSVLDIIAGDVAVSNTGASTYSAILTSTKGGLGVNNSAGTNGQILVAQSTDIGDPITPTLYVAKSLGTGTGISTTTGEGTLQINNTGVLSFNGSTGAVTGITAGGANTFTQLNTFSAGISASSGIFGNTGVKVGEHISKFLTITSDGTNNAITQNGNSTLTISHASSGDIYIGDSDGVGNSTYINVNDGTSTILLNGAVAAGKVTADAYILSSAAISAKTASYTLVAADNGTIITMNVATANNLTVPASLDVGFNCTIIQLGAGQTTIVASGTTLNSYQGYLKISGQHGSASIVSYTSNVYNVAGSLSA